MDCKTGSVRSTIHSQSRRAENLKEQRTVVSLQKAAKNCTIYEIENSDITFVRDGEWQ